MDSKMIILSHRGYWKKPSERNQKIAFERSFELGFGTETDLRDSQGKIVIAHDMPVGGEISFEDVLQLMDGRNLPLALNIKADGLAENILELLEKYNHSNYFTFDMSIPDMLVQIRRGLRVFTGLSDILPTPVMQDAAAGIWLDSFNSDWYEAEVIDNLIISGRNVCVVSADLHKREKNRQWEIIKKCKSIKDDRLMLCTDYPEDAEEFFHGKN
ncbi:phosphodiesterase [Pectobacterium aroidearum]|uniref:phosphodiesterase n=1 Tax=Pectobacterium aroidearum TaxID=1201031 RepID=UPI0033152D8E